MTSHLDIYPTICDLLGVDPPPWLRGRSLLPLVAGEVADLHDELFFEVTYHAAYEPMRAVRTKRWKHIQRFGGRTTPVLPNCDDGESKSCWLQHGWRNHSVREEALFDLVFDPNEMNNLVDDPASQAILRDLKSRLTLWMETTADPLLRGKVPAPEGAVVNDPNGLSPKERAGGAQQRRL